MVPLPSRTKFPDFSGASWNLCLGAGTERPHSSWVKATVTLPTGADFWNDKHISSHPVTLRKVGEREVGRPVVLGAGDGAQAQRGF